LIGCILASLLAPPLCFRSIFRIFGSIHLIPFAIT
jgi:hypothetical protein